MPADELCLLVQLHQYLVLLQFGGTLHAFGNRLLREAFLIDAVDGVADVEEVLDHYQRVCRKEREEGRPLADRVHFGHDDCLVAVVLRQLCVDLEGAYAVDVVAEKVDAQRQLAAERVDIQYAAS